MSAQQIMEDVMQMQFVQIQLEVLLALVNQNIQELVFHVMVMIFFFF